MQAIARITVDNAQMKREKKMRGGSVVPPVALLPLSFLRRRGGPPLLITAGTGPRALLPAGVVLFLLLCLRLTLAVVGIVTALVCSVLDVRDPPLQTGRLTLPLRHRLIEVGSVLGIPVRFKTVNVLQR